MILARFAAVVTTGMLAGCATLPPIDRATAADPGIRDCAAWFASLDRQVGNTGVRDAGSHRLPGFPYLRASRFLASFADDATVGGPAARDWLALLRDEDRIARGIEIDNLPDAAIPSLGAGSRERAIARTEQCAIRLLESDRANAAFLPQVRAAAAVPDDYSTAQRIAGIYAITSLPFYSGITAWQESTAAAFARERDVAFDPARQVRYVPDTGAAPPVLVAGLLSAAPRDANGIPHFSPDARARLLAAYAPVFEVGMRQDEDSDRPGRLEWHELAAPAVNGRHPQVYARLAFTRMRGEVHTQLAYTIWFPRRPADGAFDLVSGTLDGVVIRLTLDRDGSVLMMDSMHACGCYHEFFPSQRLAVRPPPVAGEEWAFVPARLPAKAGDARLVVRLASGSHYLTRVAASSETDGVRYRLADEEVLRALPAASGTRSLYGPDGLVAGSERAERWLFWPMGVASPGAMRQWGHHATAFVGRRHFDDAHLIELRFARTGD